MEEEEGGYVRYGGDGERGEVGVQEGWGVGEEAGEAGGGLGSGL